MGLREANEQIQPIEDLEMSKGKGFGSKSTSYSYSLRMERRGAYDFSGERVLAWVTLKAGQHKWKGWVTPADDTADGLSVTFAGFPVKQANLVLRAKRYWRESIGRDVAERLGNSYEKNGSDYVESVFAYNALPAKRFS